MALGDKMQSIVNVHELTQPQDLLKAEFQDEDLLNHINSLTTRMQQVVGVLFDENYGFQARQMEESRRVDNSGK